MKYTLNRINKYTILLLIVLCTYSCAKSNYIDNPKITSSTEIINRNQLIAGVCYIDNPEYYSNLSPYYATKETSPPIILFYGGMDNLVPV